MLFLGGFMKKLFFLIFPAFIFWGCSDSPSTATNTAVCKNITCGEHGTCVPVKDKPACVCDEGYTNIEVAGVPTCGLTNGEVKCGETTCEDWQECKEDKCETKEGFCASDEDCNEQICDLTTHTCKDEEVNPCENIDCSGHGNCSVVDGVGTCNCEDGYKVDGLTCQPRCWGVVIV